ncbi:MAG: peptidase [Deltaproteobacteria bacterium]|nr:peptidase [Deltaproteobacteria bacterium]
MDTSFIGKPHEYDPRRVYSLTGADWQERVNFERLRRERLARAKQQMEIHDLGALVVYDGANVRYLTSSFQGNWKYNIFIRYAVLPRGGEPILFETAGSDMQEYMVDRMVDSVLEVLREHKVEKEKIGIDSLDMASLAAFQKKGIKVVNAMPAMSAARVVKTVDEIELLKQSAAIADACTYKARYEWAKPGITERELSGKMIEYMYSKGCEIVYEIIVASGGNTSPYRRWPTDKIIRQGDLIIIDNNTVGPSGYFVDYVRCWKCEAKPTQKEKDLYKECYDSLMAAIEMMKPGNTSKDVAEKFPVYDDDKYGTVTLQQFAHSIGLTLYEGMWISRAYSLKYPAEIKPNMYFAVETFAGHPGLEQTVRLESDLIITDKGHEFFTMFPFEEEMLK